MAAILVTSSFFLLAGGEAGAGLLLALAISTFLGLAFTHALVGLVLRLAIRQAAREARRKDGVFILVQKEAGDRSLLSHGMILLVALQLAGVAFIVGAGAASVGFLAGAWEGSETPRSDWATASVGFGMFLAPFLALGWSAIWLPSHSKIRLLSRDTGLAERIHAWWPLRLVGPTLLFSGLAMVARQAEKETSYVEALGLQFAGVLMIYPLCVLVTVCFAHFTMVKAYASLDRALAVQAWPDVPSALAGNAPGARGLPGQEAPPAQQPTMDDTTA